MSVLTEIVMPILAILTALWVGAFWRVFIQGGCVRDDFDACLARRFRVFMAGVALCGVWLGLLVPLLRR
ncbi:hypothetical protein [Fimbriiglobus ruber]|uniref:Uncharacterized protein n=1 Tax=Fimbriiglobus ruber TaxID=1908690 RepID=A0A225D510_9BACT|nr:hypothetical protein [Fimbriiglobus ruber]OWK36033.1 hypothetical protein FRUB_08596 [Fimbriiglobus ruber]